MLPTQAKVGSRLPGTALCLCFMQRERTDGRGEGSLCIKEGRSVADTEVGYTHHNGSLYTMSKPFSNAEA